MLVYQEWMKYLVYYPEENEAGFDGVHYGGIKGLSEDAPREVQKAYRLFVKEQAEAERLGIRLW